MWKIHYCTSVLIIFFVAHHSVRGIPVNEDNDIVKTNVIPPELLKGLRKCTSEGGITGIINCAAARVLKNLQKAEDEPALHILPGVSLASNGTQSRSGKSVHLEDLPTNPEDRATKLLNMLLEASSRFISSRTLKIKLPSITPEKLSRALEEGRGKMKKTMGPLMLGLGAKMLTIVPIMMGGLALLAAKALLVGKLAFVISIILFVQYFFSGRPIIPFSGYGGGNTYGYGYGTNYGGYGGTNQLGGWGYSSQYPYARSIDVAEEPADVKSAQDLAYAEQKI